MSENNKSQADKNRLIELVKKASAGDEASFELLYHEKFRSILYTASNILHSKQDAQDAAQEVIMAMYNKIGSLRQPEYFNTWLFRITTNVCNNMIRKRMNRKEVIDEERYEHVEDADLDFIPEEYVKNAEQRQVLLDALNELPERRKMALYFYYFEEMSYEEISEATGLSTGMIASNISRGKKNLKEALEKDGYVAGQDAESRKKGAMAFAPAISQLFVYDSQSLFSDEAILKLEEECKEMITKNASGVNAGIKNPKVILSIFGAAVICAIVVAVAVIPQIDVPGNNNGEVIEQSVTTEQKSESVTDDTKKYTDKTKETMANSTNSNVVEKDLTNEKTNSSTQTNVPQQGKTIAYIDFTGGQCACGHVNPKESIIKDLTNTDSELIWQIQAENGAEVLSEGKGTTITKELTELATNKADGKYSVNYFFDDENGYPVHLRRVFQIYSKSIYDNQFE